MCDESLLLKLLNTTPVVDGVPADELGDRARARDWLTSVGGDGSEAEWRLVREVREVLQAAVSGEPSPDVLASLLVGTALIPVVTAGEIAWELSVAPDRALAVRAILAWDALAKTRPGRLRRCANDECHLFLIDRSRAGTARWCSMASCGNRLKARRHYQKTRTPES